MSISVRPLMQPPGRGYSATLCATPERSRFSAVLVRHPPPGEQGLRNPVSFAHGSAPLAGSPGDTGNGTVFAGLSCDLTLRPALPPNRKVQRVADLLLAAHTRASCPTVSTSDIRNRIEICQPVPHPDSHANSLAVLS